MPPGTEVSTDGVDSVGDAPMVVLRVGGVEQFVEFGDRVDDRILHDADSRAFERDLLRRRCR
ncbi:MAG: hypothetical protein ACR2JO_11435 [Mycobacteriales bacterium]